MTTKTPEREEDEAMTKVPVSEGEPGPVSGPKSEPEPERKPAAHSPITVTVPVKDGETQAGTDQPEPDCVPDVPAGPLEEMTVSQLQQVILQKLSERGPVTELMRAQVKENIWKDSLLNWARSFS